MRHFIAMTFLALSFSSSPAAAQPTFQPMDVVLVQDTDQRVWFDSLRSFEKQFDYICPDTFCEGEYSNLRSMGFDCAVDTTTQTVAHCAWQFYGSYQEIDPATGVITFPGQAYACSFEPNVNVTTFLGFLKTAGNPTVSGYSGLEGTPLPGQTRTLWDVLLECL